MGAPQGNLHSFIFDNVNFEKWNVDPKIWMLLTWAVPKNPKIFLNWILQRDANAQRKYIPICRWSILTILKVVTYRYGTFGGKSGLFVAITITSFVIVMLRRGHLTVIIFATNTTIIHYFLSVPHPMEEPALPIHIEEGTDVPTGECS